MYVDANVYGDLLAKNGEKHKETGEKRWKIAKAVFDAVNSDRVVLAASALIEAEVMCLGDYRSGSQSVHDMVRGWFTARSTLWTDVDRFLAADAAKLARRWHSYRANDERKLGGADATHLAAAIRLGCNFLLTHDEGFPLGMEVDGVRVMRPDIVWQTNLDDELADHLAQEQESSEST